MPSVPLPTPRALTFWGAGVVVMLLGATLGNQDAVWPALFLLLLPVAALVAVVVTRPSFTVERSVNPPVVGAGEPVTVEVATTVRRPVPAGSVVAEDDPGPALGSPHRVRLGASHEGERTVSHYPVRPRRRGRYTLDGLRYRFTDLFGFWVHTARLPLETGLVVTPTVVPLPATAARAYGATGETPIPQTAISGPDDVLVREYQPRDDVRRIHWPSTARSGTLMVRREEAAWDPTAWVLLDSRAGVHPLGHGESPSFEWLVSAAASVGLRLLADGYTVTLVDAEGSRTEVAADRPTAQARWLDPLVDIDLTGATELHGATTRLAQSSAEHLIVALLGSLDRGTADLLAATTASRQQRVALVVAPGAGRREGFEAGRGVLLDHGWDVLEAPTGSDLGELWGAAMGGGSR